MRRTGYIGPAAMALMALDSGLSKLDARDDIERGMKKRFRITPPIPRNDELHLQKAAEKRVRKAAKRMAAQQRNELSE